MKTVIGLCGKMGSGKDTAAQILKLYGFKHLSFAWHIKKFAQKVFELSDESLWGASNLRNEPQLLRINSWDAAYNLQKEVTNFITMLGLEYDYAKMISISKSCDPFIRPDGIIVEDNCLTVVPRDILRAIGDWGRDIDKDLWVKATLKEAENFDKVVISDVRYINEAKAINNLSYSGKHNSGVIKIIRNNEQSKDDHISELEQDLLPDTCFFDIYNNNRSILALHCHLVEELQL